MKKVSKSKSPSYNNMEVICMGRAMNFKQKEVVNLTDGKRLGYVQDVCADLETGKITSIIVPGGTNKLMNLFSNVNDIIIPWERIKCISEDLILVEI